MQHLNRWHSRMFALLCVASATLAHATPGPPGVHDARSIAMGGTGVAHIDNASAIFHNPASLEQIKRLSITLSFSPSFPTMTTPFTDRMSGTVTSRTSSAKFVPYFLAGAAYRILDRVVIGGAVYLETGFGSVYKAVPEAGGSDIEILVGTAEVNIPVSVRLF